MQRGTWHRAYATKRDIMHGNEIESCGTEDDNNRTSMPHVELAKLECCICKGKDTALNEGGPEDKWCCFCVFFDVDPDYVGYERCEAKCAFFSELLA